MGHRIIAAASITASLLLAASALPTLAQSQLPRPGQLPPAGGAAPQKPQAAPQQQQPLRRLTRRIHSPAMNSTKPAERPS